MVDNTRMPLPDSQAPWRDAAKPISERVELLLAAMTLAEKLAQLGSYWPRSPDDVEGEVAPMEDAMSAAPSTFEAAAEFGLGHLTRVFGASPVSPAEGVAKHRAFQAFLTSKTRLGIGAIAHEECLTGVTTLGATVYPASIAWGATFDPALIEQMAAAIGADMSKMGVHQGLSPLLDVVRDYRWGRVEETAGEDPYLVGCVGAAYVRGLQSQGVLATVKHFAGYSASRAGRNHAPVSMGPREFADVILPPFEMAVREGQARSVMNSYSDVDGQPAATNHWLLTEVLRENWGFTGTVVSDYWSVPFVQTMHRTAADLAQAGAQALAAGLDIELPETAAYGRLAELVASGELPMDVIDTAARRVLTQKAQLGLLDAGWEPTGAEPDSIDLDSPANRALAAQVAEASIILLANGAGLLPLAPTPGKVAVIGPVAAEPRSMFGCYSYPNHVMSRYGDGSMGITAPSLLEALTSQYGQDAVVYRQGCPILDEDRGGIATAVDAARAADVVVLAVGDLAGLFGRGTSGEGCDAETLALPGVQAELVSAVMAAGTPVVLVAITGRPYCLGDGVRADAIIQAFMPGAEGAGAIARVLAGQVNPSGKLPVGIPAGLGGQPSTYLAPPLGLASEGISNLDPTPAYPFGHGLSYTEFALSDLELDAAVIPPDGMVTVRVTVRNTGTRAGAEVVQLYLGDPVAQVTRPTKQLVGFAKVALEVGASVRLAFQLHADRTAFTGLDPGRRIIEPGEFRLWVGASSADLPLEARFAIGGDVRDVSRGRVLTTPWQVEAVGSS
ncbi:MAG: glycoside hydrolase family 3 C-terminal domain-containing protein [Bifidobacteriaceae bacterium]|jgi:beta-glucosidase|nr:glycoside hydrolase family 3 C-terminal domain-containing protein [Bifidobacteriaceae bacterium]